MNVRMWEHPATQANVATLRERGVELVGPESGELAEGESGVGRMAEPATILERIRELSGGSPPRARAGSSASASSSPPGEPASRSTPSVSSAIARPAAWESPSPRRRGAGAPT